MLGVSRDNGRRQGEGYARLCNDYGDVTPDIELAVGVGSRYLDASVSETLLEGFAKNDILSCG